MTDEEEAAVSVRQRRPNLDTMDEHQRKMIEDIRDPQLYDRAKRFAARHPDLFASPAVCGSEDRDQERQGGSKSMIGLVDLSPIAVIAFGARAFPPMLLLAIETSCMMKPVSPWFATDGFYPAWLPLKIALHAEMRRGKCRNWRRANILRNLAYP